MMTRALALLGVLALTGCYVSKHGTGNKENVDIGTPFGSMHVKTDPSTVMQNLGLSVYPGATAVKDSGHDNENSADINMNFGDFHLGVRAAAYVTNDSASKVEAFYRKDLSRYGAVIKCDGSTPVGEPTRTAQGLSCKDDDSQVQTRDDKGVHINTPGSANPELRAGSPLHQHIVTLEPRDGGIRIGLVALDLPAHMNFHTDKDSE
ncbi:MAG: hypothetical protein PW735_08520 [Acidobacteriaceae bacterium]|nr:hypothetical protein [Acidobacteriaceae bacterium]